MQKLDKFKKLIVNRKWRIFSGKLYKIKTRDGKAIPFKPNKVQREFYESLHTKNIILKARQLGFSTMIDIMLLDAALFNRNYSCGIIAQDLESAEDIFNNTISFAFENLPDWIRAAYTLEVDRRRELKFKNNGSSISVGTSFRGGTLQRLHISEFGKICNKSYEKAREIVTGALNTVGPDQHVYIESTAEGNEGYFYDMCQQAEADQIQQKELTKLDYKFYFYPWYEDKNYVLDGKGINRTQEIDDYFNKIEEKTSYKFTEEQKNWYHKKKQEQGDDMMREYPSTPKEAFNLIVKGAYYEKEILNVRSQKRICNVTYDDRLPVYTSWDLGGAGGGDETVIIFFQIYGREIRIIDFWQGSGYSMIDIMNTIVLPKKYNLGTAFMPHDIKVHEYTTGETRLNIAKQYIKDIQVLDIASVSEGINLVRNTFPICWFDEYKTEELIKALANYRRQFDEKNGVFRDKPLHNSASHASDGFRYMAQGYQTLKMLEDRPKRRKIEVEVNYLTGRSI